MDKIQQMLEDTGSDVILITDPHNMQYFSGFKGGEGMLYLTRNRNILITDSRYTESASRESSFEIVEESRQRRRYEIVADLLREDDAHCVGYEDQYMICSDYRLLCLKLPQVQQWIPIGGKPAEARRIKTPEELDKMARAEEIGDLAFAEILKVLKPGMTEIEAAAELEYQMKMHGGEGTSFDTIMASGKNTSMPHAVPTMKKIESGDFVTMDFGCRVGGYCSDMTRTVVVGKADDRQKEIYNTVLKANLAAHDAIRAGMKCCDVDKVARDVIADAGYGKYFGHSLGHSVGLYIHELPSLSPNDSTVLEENMIETIEPGIYIPDFGGVRIEDMVVVTREGRRNLAHSPKELIEL